jgi:hypothetical protein
MKDRFVLRLVVEGLTEEDVDVLLSSVISMVDASGGTATGGFSFEEEDEDEESFIEDEDEASMNALYDEEGEE